VNPIKYKLLALDVDGTIVGNNMLIPKQNKLAIRAAASCGIHVVLCSGRSYASLRRFVDELELTALNNYAVSFNGCVMHNTYTNEIIRNFKMPTATALQILNQLKQFDVDPVVYWDIYGIYANTNRKYADIYLKTCGATPTFINNYAEITQDAIYKIIALGDNDTLKAVERHFSQQIGNPFNMFFSGHYLFEFCNPIASKGAALSHICSLLGINIEETIAVGDSDNDISMISSAGLGVAMQNANDHVKSFASYVTTNNCINCGVTEVIEKFILS